MQQSPSLMFLHQDNCKFLPEQLPMLEIQMGILCYRRSQLIIQIKSIKRGIRTGYGNVGEKDKCH